MTDEIKFKVEDVLLKIVSSDSRFLYHVKTHGFHPALLRTLSETTAKKLESAMNKKFAKAKKSAINEDEYEKQCETISDELADIFIELFKDPSNRADKWKTL